jgi:putative endopeptidase
VNNAVKNLRKPIVAALSLALLLAAPLSQAISIADLDTSVNRCEDFYGFATGGWVKNNPIPADYGRWGAFNEISNSNTNLLREIASEAASTKAQAGSPTAIVGTFYQAGMDEATIEKLGLQPIAGDLKRIDGVSDAKSLLQAIAYLQQTRPSFSWRGPQPVGFSVAVRQDAKNSLVYLTYLGQGGLGLPDRDYYLKTDERSQKLLKEYEAHVAKMLELLGAKPEDAAAQAKIVLRIETRMAKAAMTNVERRDPDKTYNKKTLAELSQLAPAIDWSAYFASLGMKTPDSVNVMQPAFFAELSTMAKEEPAADWKHYLRWHLANAWAEHLPKAFVEQNFVLRGKLLNGKLERGPRWKSVVESADQEIGHALGQAFVTKAFKPEAKTRMDEMIVNIKAAMRESIQALEWMSDETRKAALTKLDAVVWKIGYPEQWRDYSKLTLKPDAYLENTRQAARANFAYRVGKLGQPVDRKEWGMTPPTVNAYYSASLNEIVFPAGILQPPFFDPKADDATNYGGIGMVIGHEITHGFDDNGRKYDAQGNLKPWWTKQDEERFLKRVSMIQAQYDGYRPVPDMNVNGKLTTGENIADLGGLKIAYNAFLKTKQAKEGVAIDNYSPKQRFFISLGQIWRSSYRDAYLRMQLATDSHSPPRYRVLGPLANFPEFFKEFGCEGGKTFARGNNEIVTIW